MMTADRDDSHGGSGERPNDRRVLLGWDDDQVAQA
jgi:hypothetical protein